MKILPSITTTGGVDWRGMIREAKVLGLEEVAFFPTVLNKVEREEAYTLLKENGITNIPFIHLRIEDMDGDEIDFLMKEFNTQIFNIHPIGHNSSDCDFSHYAGRIYLETQEELSEEELKNFAGICIDLAHVENYRKDSPEIYSKLDNLLKRFPIGCAHISAIKQEPRIDPKGERFDFHHFDDLSEFDYIKNYQTILPPIMALEVDNSLVEQLKVKEYISLLFD